MRADLDDYRALRRCSRSYPQSGLEFSNVILTSASVKRTGENQIVDLEYCATSSSSARVPVTLEYISIVAESPDGFSMSPEETAAFSANGSIW